MAAYKGRWPLGRGFERFYGFLGGESTCWYPDLIHDNHPVDPPATPEEGYHIAKDLSDKAIEFVRDAKVVDPDKPFFMYLSLDAAHAPHHVFKEWSDGTKASSTRDTRRSGGDSAAPERTRAAAREHRTLSDQPARRARGDRAGRPAVAAARHRPTVGQLSSDERRLFIRMAEVFAGYVSYSDDQLGRVLDFLESGQLDNTIIVAVSDNGASGEGGPSGTFNEWRFFNGLPTRPSCPWNTSTNSAARVVQPLQHRMGLGVRHTVPVLEALGRLRGRRGRHVPGRLARRDRRPGGGAPAVRSRGGRRSHALRPPRRRAARGAQGLPAEPDRIRSDQPQRRPRDARRRGTLTLYMDDQEIGSYDIVTQPGYFCVVEDGICVGRDDASPVTPGYEGPFPFAGGTIDKVVVDVSGERYVDHEAQVRGWFMID